MIGAIRTWDIVFHPLVTVRCFGWKTLFRAVLAGNNRTFLSLLSESGVLCPADPEAAAILKQCVDLELRAENIYLTLAESTLDEPVLSLFFATLAQQEQHHAELLRLCAVASLYGGWRISDLLVWRDDVARLDQEMREAETLLSAVKDVDDALRLVIQIESSEVNRIFLATMAASNSVFVQKLRPFQDAVEKHFNYIASQLAVLAPHLSFKREAGEPSRCA
ncbi:MAG: hypothetical protein WCB27_22885 [Thermoguttaceae bacterium]|jgi:hypothetical protein